MKELEVKITIRNNRLKERRLKLGLSQPDFAKLVGLSLTVYREFETMARSPRNAHGWTEAAMQLANFHCVKPRVLWPEAVLKVQKSVAVRKVDVQDLVPLLAQSQEVKQLQADAPIEEIQTAQRTRLVTDALKTLTPRETFVLVRRFGMDGHEEQTLRQVGDKMDLRYQRVRQIEAKALRKLRHPRCAKQLREAFEDGYSNALEKAVNSGDVSETVAEAERNGRSELLQDVSSGLFHFCFSVFHDSTQTFWRVQLAHSTENKFWWIWPLNSAAEQYSTEYDRAPKDVVTFLCAVAKEKQFVFRPGKVALGNPADYPTYGKAF